MEVHNRRKSILALLKDLGQASVETLAARLVVSPNTIRSDLTALDEQGLLRRVRGGAVALESVDTARRDFVLRSSSCQREKEYIARWAAGLVKDGDAIILDASSSVFHLATFLRERRNLTVVTNGLNVALLLAQERTNKVILAAKTVRADCNCLVGDLDPILLTAFRAALCFVSCSGFSLEAGFTETDVDEAALKAEMIKLARQVVVLADHTKFDKTAAFRFAGLHQIDRLVTDASLGRDQIANLRRKVHFPIVVVDASSAETLDPVASVVGGRRYRIGFGNAAEQMHFGRDVRLSLERAAQRLGIVDLLIRDNNLDRQTALENADWFVANRADLVIEFQLDAEASNVIMDKFNRADIPAIAVDVPLPGATFFGADNYRAGHMAGEGLGHWIKQNWAGSLDMVLRLEASRVGPVGSARLQGQLDGLSSVIGPITPENILVIDCPVIAHFAVPVVADYLRRISVSRQVAVIAINDDAAVGALTAFERAGRLHQVVAVGQNANWVGRTAMRRPNFPFIGSTSYAPEHYGERLLDTALRILRGDPVPPAVYTQHVYITKETVNQYYPESEDQTEL
jgi:ribose transport system substrate-binding protein